MIFMLTDALDFVARHTGKALCVTVHPQQDEATAYPEEAVREAITNALIHRDYSSAGSVRVCLHSGRLEIWNPASLPYDIPVERLYERHPSRPRNRKLADAFFRAGLIEHWGTGTMRIREACEARGLPGPKFEHTMGCIRVTLYSDRRGIA